LLHVFWEVILPKKPDFDLQSAHKYFSAHCFNKTWDLIDKPQRSPTEDEQMLQLTLASLWHWTQRVDCTPLNMAIGYWQVSRVYALLGQADHARRYGQLSLDACGIANASPFYFGFAYEALARAEKTAGDSEATGAYLQQAREYAEKVSDQEERQMLLKDLATLL
jgi:hypothetical protein